ncbi:hypothetical protein OKW21_001808 [Catalinimonas alkaloidigena]|uniref:hypothetical protein n=1 Tax=Catalinimonas alkaloidigena TaxID=1075417 RepID=UPI002405FC50|nr:hypothetical protein [Catalinimonas alkaloidigena]MDF9796545.1 hypothetical protein [Catalinimonas alkaloidigena]
MKTNPDIPGKYEKVFTINLNALMTFESIKSDLLTLEEVEDVSFNNQVTPCEMTIYSDEEVNDATVQQIVAKHGHQAQPKKFLIS